MKKNIIFRSCIIVVAIFFLVCQVSILTDAYEGSNVSMVASVPDNSFNNIINDGSNLKNYESNYKSASKLIFESDKEPLPKTSVESHLMVFGIITILSFIGIVILKIYKYKEYK